LQIRDIRDGSSQRRRTLFVCVPQADADPELVREQLLEVYGLFARLDVKLPRPLGTMIRQWAAKYRDEDILASLAALEAAVAARTNYEML
jgi:hypothetical protein